LASVGYDELLADNVDDYIDIAASLAEDRSRLIALSSSLRAQMAASPLCDAPGFARRIERAYSLMWQRWCEQS